MTSRVRKNRTRSWFFTLDNADETMWAQLANYFKELSVDYVFQLEKAESGMIHFQGVIRYPNPRECWPNISAHWEKCRNWRKAVKYCSKVETRIAGPWTNIPKLKFRETIRDPMEGLKLHNWQIWLKKILVDEPDNRKVYWLHDFIGGKGKSTFCKHLVMSYPGAYMVSGANKDCLFGLSQYMESNDLKLVLFDISRSQHNNISYQTIEQVKNGLFYSQKYESRQCLFNPPHVVIFSNFYPDKSQLSEDRWEIHDLDWELFH